MKVYVAGKFEDRFEIRTVMNRLRAVGHEVTHDWTYEDPGDLQGDALASFLTHCAEADMNGVLEADILVLINHKLAFGAAAEMGMAIAWGKVVYVVGPEIRDNIFFHLKEADGMRLFSDLDSCLAAIEEDSLADEPQFP